MIGQLINQFDNQDDNSVKAFNKLFKTSLEFEGNNTVKIGEMLIGGFRELTVGVIKTRVLLGTIVKVVEKVKPIRSGRPSPYKYMASKGDTKLVFGTLEEVGEYFELGYKAIHYKIKTNKAVEGFKLTRKDIFDANNN